MQPSVSILLNNYNYAAYLGEAIESALRQTVAPLEVIVVDDGSTDHSRVVMAGFGERIQAIYQENRGQRSAYNSGYRVSHGDLVLFLDADDLLFENAVEEICRHWRDGAAKLHFALQLMLQGEKIPGARVPLGKLAAGNVVAEILRGGYYNSPPSSGQVFARSVLEKIMPMPEVGRYAADMYTGYMAPFYGEVIAVEETLGVYRIHGSNYNGSALATSGERVRGRIQEDMERAGILEEAAARQGLVYDRRVIEREVHHLKARLASLRLDPDGHPYGQESRWKVMVGGIAATVRTKSMPFSRKLLFLAWFMALAMAPSPLVPHLVAIGLNPTSRGKVLRAFLPAGS